MHLVQAILLALLQRERTGRGQQVAVSLFESMLAMQMQEAAMGLMRGRDFSWGAYPLTGAFRDQRRRDRAGRRVQGPTRCAKSAWRSASAICPRTRGTARSLSACSTAPHCTTCCAPVSPRTPPRTGSPRWKRAMCFARRCGGWPDALDDPQTGINGMKLAAPGRRRRLRSSARPCICRTMASRCACRRPGSARTAPRFWRSWL